MAGIVLRSLPCWLEDSRLFGESFDCFYSCMMFGHVSIYLLLSSEAMKATVREDAVYENQLKAETTEGELVPDAALYEKKSTDASFILNTTEQHAGLVELERAGGDLSFPSQACIDALGSLKTIDLDALPQGESTKVLTGQIFLFNDWDGNKDNAYPFIDKAGPVYEGDRDAAFFGDRPRWFILDMGLHTREAYNFAAEYGGGGPLSFAYHPGFETSPRFWWFASPRVIVYKWKYKVNPDGGSPKPKLIDGRSFVRGEDIEMPQDHYEKLLRTECKLPLTPINNRGSYDRFKEKDLIAKAFMAAGIDGILEDGRGDDTFGNVVLFSPGKHLQHWHTWPGEYRCNDVDGPHFRYSFHNLGEGYPCQYTDYAWDGEKIDKGSKPWDKRQWKPFGASARRGW